MKVLLSFFLLFSCAFANISTVVTANQLRDHLKQADAHTLVLFDIDMVLLQPLEPSFQMANMQNFEKYVSCFLSTLTHEEIELFFNLVNTSYDSLLIDPEFPCLIRQLCFAGIHTFAFTAHLTGSFGSIHDMVQWKIDRLKQFNIQFNALSPIIFNDLPHFRGGVCQLKEGILFSNGQDKGLVLLAFLEQAQIKPSRVVFIDDRKENLISVEKALLKHHPDIAFEGVEFLGAMYCKAFPVSEAEFSCLWQALKERLQYLK